MSEKKKELKATVQEFGTVNKNGRIYTDPMVFEKGSPYAEPEKKLKQPMVFDVPTKSVEDKIYIALFVVDSNDSMFDGQFKICNGRTEMFRHIESLVEAFGTDLDVHESKIITETKQTETDTGNTKYYMINYEEALSVYAFCKSVENFYGDNAFHIDDYFGPPENNLQDKYNDKLDAMAYSYAAAIEDPVIAQVAMETFKERQKALKFPAFVEQNLEQSGNKPYVSSREEFPELFENNNDGSINV